MKILYLITGLGIGGAERQVVDLADSLTELGHDVAIVYLTGLLLTEPRSAQINILGLDVKKSTLGFFCAYIKLRQFIKEYKPDVIHSHMVHANLLARLVRISCKLPRLICTSHSVNEGGRVRMVAYRLTDFLADISTNVSNIAVSAFEATGAVKPGRMIPIHNGIDTNKFLPSHQARYNIRKLYNINDDEKIILTIGRLNIAKDFPNLLSAFAIIPNKTNKIKLWIVGDGELREHLRAEAVKLKIEDNTRFLGAQRNIADWLNAADLFVLPSAWEGFGLVIAEAMACEKIVVATDAGGVKEVLGDLGYLVPIRSPQLLASAIQRAFALSVAESAEIGKKSRARICELYSMDQIVSKWISLYTSPNDSFRPFS